MRVSLTCLPATFLIALRWKPRLVSRLGARTVDVLAADT